MSDADIRAEILRILGDIAPEADLAHIDGGTDLREQLDIDSMDFLNLLVAVAETLHVEIPERDYAQVVTLDAMVAYLAARRGGG